MKKLILLGIMTVVMLMTACGEKADSKPETKATEAENQPQVQLYEPETVIFESIDQMLDWLDSAEMEHIVVVGEFVSDDKPLGDVQNGQQTSFFTSRSQAEFKIQRVLEGDIEVGETINISQCYYYKDSDFGGKTIENNSCLTPMKKGDRWIYILGYNEKYSVYEPMFLFQGRYPVPPSEESRAEDFTTSEMGVLQDHSNGNSIYNSIVDKYDWN